MKLAMGVLFLVLVILPFLATPRVQFGGWVRVVVTPGDTEWSIAENNCPSVDTRLVVSAIEARNHTNGTITIGQVLLVPTVAH